MSIKQKYQKYKFQKELGSGGFGFAYLMKYQNQYIVDKTIRTQPNNAQFMKALNSQCETITKLNHPSLVKGFGFYDQERLVKDRPTENYRHVIMEYVQTKLLSQYLRQVLNQQQILTFYKNVRQGLQYLHSQRIAHMDIKPENIFFDQKTMAIKIIDLGGAKASDSRFTKGIIFKSNYYQSPQLAGGYISEKADQWAVGITLLLMVLKQEQLKFDEMVIGNAEKFINKIPKEYSSIKSIVKMLLMDDSFEREWSLLKNENELLQINSKAIGSFKTDPKLKIRQQYQICQWTISMAPNNPTQALNVLQFYNTNYVRNIILSQNNLTDIKSLVRCSFNRLEKLDLSNNLIEDVSIIGKQTVKPSEDGQKLFFCYLKQLRLNGNKIKNIASFKNYNNKYLQVLQLEHNEIQDGSPLANIKLPELKQLNLADNKIASIDFLSNLTFIHLQTLALDKNQIVDISKLQKAKFLKGLKILTLNYNKFSNAQVVQKCDFQRLQILKLSSNAIKQFPKLNIKTLIEFNIGRNHPGNTSMICAAVKDLKLSSVKILNLQYNKFGSLATNLKFPELQRLLLAGNELTDITNLATWSIPNIVYLKLNCNRIVNILPLKQLDTPKLIQLRLDFNEIEDVLNIKLFTKMPLLQIFNLQANLIGIIPDVNDLPFKLKSLNVANNVMSPFYKTIYKRANLNCDFIIF